MCLCALVVVVRSTLSGAISAGQALAGRMFAGKAIEVQFIPEAEYRAKHPDVQMHTS